MYVSYDPTELMWAKIWESTNCQRVHQLHSLLTNFQTFKIQIRRSRLHFLHTCHRRRMPSSAGNGTQRKLCSAGTTQLFQTFAVIAVYSSFVSLDVAGIGNSMHNAGMLLLWEPMRLLHPYSHKLQSLVGIPLSHAANGIRARQNQCAKSWIAGAGHCQRGRWGNTNHCSRQRTAKQLCWECNDHRVL